jgi:predicted RNA-binding Zn-ribbon protein involved in translation (DUF1610 family)
MATQVTCGVCGKELSVPDDTTGQITKCPNCGEPLTVPSGPGRLETKPGAAPATARGSYRREKEEMQVPNYRRLAGIAGVFTGLALVHYLAALVALVASIREAARPDSSGAPDGLLLVLTLGLATVGTLLYAASAACRALRDIARNSFAWRRGD